MCPLAVGVDRLSVSKIYDKPALGFPATLQIDFGIFQKMENLEEFEENINNQRKRIEFDQNIRFWCEQSSFAMSQFTSCDVTVSRVFYTWFYIVCTVPGVKCYAFILSSSSLPKCFKSMWSVYNKAEKVYRCVGRVNKAWLHCYLGDFHLGLWNVTPTIGEGSLCMY